MKLCNQKALILLLVLVVGWAAAPARAADYYWSGGSGSSDNIDQDANWFGPTHPSSGDNLYFNNTTGSRHWPFSNYGAGSYFNFLITYSGAGGIRFRGDTTYANKFENNNDPNIFEIEANIGNRSGPDLDLEINPVGSGGMLVSNTVSITGSSKWVKVYGTNQVVFGGVVSGSSASLALMQGATAIMLADNTFTGDIQLYGGILDLRSTTDPLDVSTNFVGDTAGAANATLRLGASGVTIDSPINVRSGNTGAMTLQLNAAGTGTMNNTVTLNKATTADVVTSGTLTISGAISGAGSLTKTSAGALTLSNTGNAFTGGLVIKQGTVTAGANNNLVLGNGTIQLGDSATGQNAEIVTANGVFPPAIANGNTLTVDSGAGTRTITILSASAGQLPIFTGGVTLNNTLTVSVTSLGGVRFNGVINDGAGSNGLIVDSAGTGVTRVNQANTFDGGVVIKRGTVEQNGAAAGLGTGTLTLGDTANAFSATLSAAGTGFTAVNAITVAAGNTGVSSINGNGGGSAFVYSGAVALNHSLTLNELSTGTLRLSGSITGIAGAAVSITNSGSGTGSVTLDTGVIASGAGGTVAIVQNSSTSSLLLNGVNTFSGSVTLRAGTVQFNATSGLGNTANVVTLGDASGAAVTLRANGLGGSASNIDQPVTVAGTGVNTISGIWPTGGQINLLRGLVTLSSQNLIINSTGASGWRIQAGVTGTGNLTLQANGTGGIDLRTVAINNTGTITNSGTGSGGISQGSATSIGANVTGLIQNSGTSTWTLNQANGSFAGFAQVLAGTLAATSASGLNVNNAVSVASGATFDVRDVSLTVASLDDVSGAGGTVTDTTGTAVRTLTLGGSRTNSFSGVITATTPANMAVTKSGSGTQTLAGNNTYAGATILSGGTLKLGHVNALGTAAGNTTCSGGSTLDLNAITTAEPISITGAFTLANTSASTGGLSADAGATSDFTVDATGDITATRFIGSGSPRTLTKNGNGKLTTSGTSHNNLMALQLNAGTVVFANTSGYGADRGVTITAGTLKLSGANSDLINDGQAFTVNGGAFDLNGKSEAVAAVGGSGGTIRNDLISTTSTLYVGGGVSGTSSASYAGVIANGTGTLAVAKEGTGTQTLTGVNTYTGSTTVSAGGLTAGSTQALGVNSAVTMANVATAILNITGFNNSIGSLTGGGTTGGNVTLGAATLTIGGDNTSPAAYAGVISGTGGSLIKTGSGTLTLTGASTFASGSVTIKAGTISIDDTAGLGNTANVVTLGDSGGAAVTLAVNGATVASNLDQPVTVGGTGVNTISGTWNNGGQINLLRGLVTLSSQNLIINSTAASGWRIQAGITGTGNLTLKANGSGNIDLRTVAINNTGSITNAGTGTGSVTIGNSTANIFGANVTSLIQNSATSAWNINQPNANFVGTVQVLAGNMNVSSATGLNVNNSVAVASGATCDVQNVSLTVAGLNDVGGAGGTVTDTAGTAVRTLTLGGSGTYAFSGVITATTPADMAITKSGSGTQTLSGTNTYDGLTTVSAGTLRLGSTTALGATNGTTVVSSGATLDLNGQSIGEYFTGLDGTGVGAAGALVNSNVGTPAAIATDLTNLGNFSVGGSGDITLTRVNRNAVRTVTKDGSGTLILAGPSHNNLYQWTVNAGTLELAKTVASQFAADRAITINGGTVKITGSGGNQINNSETVTVNGGTFDINGHGEAIGALAAAAAGGTAQNGSASAAILFVGGSTAGTASGSYAGLIQNGTGVLSLTKEGTGTQTLTGSSTYSGTTTVSGGGLVVNGTHTGAGAYTVQSGGTLGGTGTIHAPSLTINAGGTIVPGASVGTLTVDTATLSGTYVAELDRNLSPNADLLNVTGALTLGGTLTVSNIGGTIQGGDTFDIFDAGSVSGAFATINLPALHSGLGWDTSLLNSQGILSVYGDANVTIFEFK